VKAGGGDLIQTTDGRTGRVSVTRISLTGRGEPTYYGLYGAEGERRTPDWETEPHRWVAEDDIERILEVGRHEYGPGKVRGHCYRCGVRKRDHHLVGLPT
jgi:hypothetical protein